MKFSVQLYSLRDDIKDANGLLAILPKLKEIGFDGVEFAGYYGLDAKTLKKALDDAGLVATGTHTGCSAFLPSTIDDTIAFHKELGMEYIGVGGGAHGTDADAEKTALIFEWANKYGADKGVKFYYHTHSSEFNTLESGRVAIDVLMKGAYMEIDTFWSFVAGIDTKKFLLENKDRIVYLHIKDGIGHSPCALGEGENDLISVIEAAKEMGHEWLVLENDDPKPTGLEDVARSMKFLKEHAL
ncbi:MAG: sugar phosphate isomerase/epimerase [Clostridiales bacterium]|nr:sugar phosphate isomerase/epimerase [Clostridiales bacterium]